MNFEDKMYFDENELRRFYDLVCGPLPTGEVRFLSFSARNKYLTATEREFYSLGRTEMFMRRTVRHDGFEALLHKVHQMYTAVPAYTTRNNIPIPKKALVLYFNINPSSSLKALEILSAQLSQIQSDLVTKAVGGKDFSQDLYKLDKLDTMVMDAYQKAQVKGKWLDIDVDIPHEHVGILHSMLGQFRDRGVRFIVITTKSGYHVLLDRTTLKFNFNEVLSSANVLREDRGIEGEIIVNKNGMIPLPGTSQGGFPVKLFIWHLG